MQHIVQNKTQELLERLSDQQMYFTPNDLLDAGYPEFLIERIRLEVERNLADSVSLPESDWADMRADQVQNAWDHFLIAIRAETRIPVSYCRSVTENAVEDVLDLFSKPRNYILETLFRDEKKAGLDDLSARKKWIVINGVLADSVLRYMQRKNLTTLSRDKAEYVLVEVDKKLTSGFTPLKWAQHLESLFQFLGNQVPAQILSDYFVDRGMLSESKRINRGDEVVTRSTFIEMISEAGIYEEDILDESDVMNITVESNLNVVSDVPELSDENQSNADKEDSTGIHHSITDTINRVDFTITPDFIDDKVDTTTISPGDTLTLEEAIKLDQQLPSINDLNKVEEDPFDLDENQDEMIVEDIHVDKIDFNIGSDTDAEEFISLADQFQLVSDQVIMEDSVLEPTELDHPGIAESADPTELDQSGIAESADPTELDQSDEDEDSHVIYLTERAKQLLVLLEPNLEEFIIEIFLNDELEFYKHLENISSYTEWRMAGRYITRDVFDKNRIDLYSEPAITFTDAVQEFFDQNEN